MIINIAGTSGSGKSYLISKFRVWLEDNSEKVKPNMVSGQANPIGYSIKLKGRKRWIYLVGSYNSPTGGCDTIKNVEDVFGTVADYYNLDFQVIYEGLFVMNMTRGPKLVAELDDPSDLAVLQLTTPLSVCIASINDRRAARGEGPLTKKDNTRGNYVRAANYCDVMRGAGARVIRVNRDQALQRLLGLLKEGDASGGLC